jgi:hypothetical protein
MSHEVFESIDDVLWRDVGSVTAQDYAEQTLWMLFSKNLDDLEHEGVVGCMASNALKDRAAFLPRRSVRADGGERWC